MTLAMGALPLEPAALLTRPPATNTNAAVKSGATPDPPRSSTRPASRPAGWDERDAYRTVMPWSCAD